MPAKRKPAALQELTGAWRKDPSAGASSPPPPGL